MEILTGLYATHKNLIDAVAVISGAVVSCAAIIGFFWGKVAGGCLWLWGRIYPKQAETTALALGSYSGPWQGSDFDWQGFDWTPTRIYKKGYSASMLVSAPKCRQKIRGRFCGGRVQPEPSGRVRCTNNACAIRMQSIPMEYEQFIAEAREEAIRRDGKGKLKFPPVPLT